ncbi:MAG: MBL fold metallo-hydrolase [Acidobacteria bacterium]|nr:MBL fold metallo-hydrolase [Acidobacteriota bacterium]
MRTRLLVGLTVAACVGGALPLSVGAQGGAPAPAVPLYPTEQQMKQSPEAQQHIAKAMAIGTPDLVAQAENACHFMGPQRPALERQAAGQQAAARQRMEPVKLFDNLYYMGYTDIGAWAITTSDGIILLDTLNSTQDAEDLMVPDMRKLGLDPATIKHAIVGHGHFDHFGGASYFQQKGARISLTAIDWDLIERVPANQTPQQTARPRPKRDLVLTDGQKITLGDTTLTILAQPGHTEGAIAVMFPVKEKGRTYNAMLLSGANQTPNPASLAAFEKALATAKRDKAALLLNGHPGLFGDEIGWMEAIRKNPAGPNPFVYGEARFARYIDIMTECARARIAAMRYKAS